MNDWYTDDDCELCAQFLKIASRNGTVINITYLLDLLALATGGVMSVAESAGGDFEKNMAAFTDRVRARMEDLRDCEMPKPCGKKDLNG